ncbi:MAG: acyl carrier protein [Armatimonadetes bacterium]|nr:acyl carrier protein [Armatimonadota bacterium]
MVTPDEIRAALAEIARKELRHEGPLPDGDLSALLDSMQRLALLVAVEDRFKVVIGPEHEQEIRTVDDLVNVVVRAANG